MILPAAKTIIAVLGLSLFCSCSHSAGRAELSNEQELCAAIEMQRAAAKAPGAAVALTSGARMVWSRGFGWADLSENRPVDDATVFHLASVSKTIVAVALMQLWQDGQFQLDDDIQPVLPFVLRNPDFPDAAITYRHLMTHTSSIVDNADILLKLYRFGAQPDMNLPEYMAAYLSPDGTLYDAQNNFGNYLPGSRFQYSNIATALAALLVEVLSNTDFAMYCQTHIFAPLGMDNTSWDWMDFAPSELAMPYTFEDGQFIAYGHYSYPDYPSGSLHTSAPQLARFLMAMAGDGSWNGIRLLEPKALNQIRRVQLPEIAPNQGLFWHYAQMNGTALFGHTGGERGAATLMFYRPEDKVGVIVLTNGEWTGGPEDEALNGIAKSLFDAAPRFGG